MIKAITMLLAGLVLAGCANQPSTPDTASTVPSDRLYSMQAPQPGYGTIQVLRDTGMTGSGCSIDVFINRERAATLEPGEAATFQVKPGRTLIEAESSGMLCSGRDTSVETVTPDETYYFRTASDGAFSVTLSPTMF